MTEPSTTERLDSKEGRIKAANLFSQKFRDYLRTKNLSTTQRHAYSRHTKAFVKEYSGSSSETASESSKKSVKKPKKKQKEKVPYWNVQPSLRNRLVQCSLLQNEAEVVPPDGLSPLLSKITIFIQDQNSPELENLQNLIVKIILLVAQFARRPLHKIPEFDKGEHMKNAEKTVTVMMALLDGYKKELSMDPDNSVREYKQIEKDIANKEEKLTEVKKKIDNKIGNPDLKVKNLELLVRNSILLNEKLKFDIKYNQSLIKNYKKAVVEKEWIKHKLENELAHLKKKVSKVDVTDNESLEKLSNCSESNLKKELYPRAHLKNTKIKKRKKSIK